MYNFIKLYSRMFKFVFLEYMKCKLECIWLNAIKIITFYIIDKITI